LLVGVNMGKGDKVGSESGTHRGGGPVPQKRCLALEV